MSNSAEMNNLTQFVVELLKPIEGQDEKTC